MTHRDPAAAPETRDSVARALIVAVLVILVANIAMTVYVFIFVRRLIEAFAQISP